MPAKPLSKWTALCVPQRAERGRSIARALAAMLCAFTAPCLFSAQSIVSSEQLETFRERANRVEQRRHAWEHIQRLPDFLRWHSEDETFDGREGTRPVGAQPFFLRSRSAEHGSHSIANAPLISYTHFNAAAYAHIRGQRLYSTVRLDDLRRTGARDERIDGNRTVPDFPVDAVVMKSVWWPIAGDRPTALPVWDPDINPSRRGGNDYMSWKRRVMIDPASEALASFTHIYIGAAEAALLMREEGVSKAVKLALGRGLVAGDILLLVGGHIATKEIADWIWITYWWHDAAEAGPFAAGRPSSVRGAGRHYLMDVAFDENLPLAADGGPNVSFNPWLEGRFPDGGHGSGRASNCMTCHRRASYPTIAFLPVTRGNPNLQSDPSYALDRLRTNFLWSIAQRKAAE